jgi:hypothetical protein
VQTSFHGLEVRGVRRIEVRQAVAKAPPSHDLVAAHLSAPPRWSGGVPTRASPPGLPKVPRWLRRASSVALLIFAINGAVAGAKAADAPCPVFPPVSYLIGEGIYTDLRGSNANPAAVKRNEESSAGVTRFMRYAEQALDNPGTGPGHATQACAHAAFRQWAAAGALTGKPPEFNRVGGIEDRQFAIGLNVIALKFKAAGYPIDATILGWLRRLADQNMTYFRGGSVEGNLAKWSGANLALFAVLSHDPAALQYQDQVWRAGISTIRPDGMIVAELRRGDHSLFYHNFSLSAMLLHRAARQVLGYPASPADLDRLKLLAAMIGRALCDPNVLEGPAQTTTLSKPKDWGYRIPVAFGRDVLTPDWSRCGIGNPRGTDVSFGGDEERTAAMLLQLTKARRL